MATIHPVVDEGLGNSAYLVELGDGRALVVDPARDPTPYLELARWRRLRIAYAAETHLHADFVTGSRELAAADGAQVLAPRASRLGFSHKGLEDGEEVDLGGLTLRALTTPGHAPEHVSYLLLDGGRPLALFCGGSLLVGTVARTDLAGPELTEPLARAAYQSLHQRLLSLPDELGGLPDPWGRVVLLGPGRAASGRPPSAPNAATTRCWPPPTRTPSSPSYSPASAATRPTSCGCGTATGPAPSCSAADWRVLPLLSTGQVRAHLAGGGVLVDARPVTAFAAGHIPGSLSIALRPQFASWLGWLVDDAQPWCSSSTRTRTAPSWPASAAPSATTTSWASSPAAWPPGGPPASRSTASPGRGRADRRPPGVVLDVRQASEFADGHLPGAVTVELGALAGDISDGAARRAGHGDVWPRRAGHDRRQPARPRRPQGPPVAHRRPRGLERATGQALTRP